MRGGTSGLKFEDLFYYPGQTETVKAFYVPAHHTTASKEIWLELQLGKSYKYINSLELKSFKAITRHSLGGYAFNKTYIAEGYDYLSSTYSFIEYNITKINDYTFRVVFKYGQPVPVYDNKSNLLTEKGIDATNNIIFFLDIRELILKFI